ncbi:MAG: DinB family protein [Dehalococcoidales bacterium]
METKELIQNGLRNVKRTFDRTLDSLTSAELKWQPRPDAGSIGLIIFHTVRYEDLTLQSRLQGKSELWESEKWYQKLGMDAGDSGSHYTEEQVAAFVVPKIEDLLSYAEAVRTETLEYLKAMTADEFDRKIVLPPRGTPPRSVPAGTRPPAPTAGSMLLMIVTHSAQHVGEISYLRGLQRGMDK